MLRIAGLALLLAVVAVAAAPVGSPVQLSYVYSDSMEPTIGVDDGYVIVPPDGVSPGDVVTFWSPSKHAYVTHRVVDRTPGGFVTQGDNNPTTDQAAGYAPVSRDRIVGEVLSVDGHPLVVPHVGTVVRFVRTNLLAVLAAALASIALYSAARGDATSRSVTRLGSVFRPLFAVALVSITGLLAFGPAAHEVTLVAIRSTTDAPGVISVGASKDVGFVLQQGAHPLLTRVVETHGLTATTRSVNATAVSVSGTVPAPQSTGPVRVAVGVNQYPSVLPHAALAHLQAVHPVLASAACAVVVLLPVWLGYHALVDPATPVRERPTRWLQTLRRRWR